MPPACVKAYVKRGKTDATFLPGSQVTLNIGAVLPESNDEWQLQHRIMRIEAMTGFAHPMIDETPQPQIVPKAA